MLTFLKIFFMLLVVVFVMLNILYYSITILAYILNRPRPGDDVTEAHCYIRMRNFKEDLCWWKGLKGPD